MRKIAAHEEHVIPVSLEASQAITFTLRTRAAPIAVQVKAPDRSDVANVAHQAPEMMPRPVVLWTPVPVRYLLRINTGVTGEYEIGTSPLRPAGDVDKQYGIAQKLAPEVSKRRFDLTAALRQVEIYRGLNDRRMLAAALVDLAAQYAKSFEMTKEITALTEALQIFIALGNRAEEFQLRWDLAPKYAARGEYQKGLDEWHRVVDAARVAGSRRSEITALMELGGAYNALGDHQRSIDTTRQALMLVRSASWRDLTNEAEALFSMAGASIQKGIAEKNNDDLRTSAEYLDQAIEIYRELKAQGNRLGMTREGHSLSSLSLIATKLGDMPTALDHATRALKIAEELRYLQGEIEACLRMGEAYIAAGEKPTAAIYLERAQRLIKNDSRPISRLSNFLLVARDLSSMGESDKAREVLLAAIEIGISAGNRDGLIRSLNQMVRLEIDRRDLVSARRYAEQAMALLEELRTNISSDALRQQFFKTRRSVYELYVELLMEQRTGRPDLEALALTISEKARARGLLDLLSHAGVDLTADISHDLRSRYASIRQDLSDKAYQQDVFKGRNEPPDVQQRVAAELATIMEQYERVQGEVFASSPRYSSIAQAQPVTADQIRALLDEDTVLLEYALGERKSFLWVVSRDRIQSYELPARAEIENRATGVHKLISRKPVSSSSPDPGRELSDALRNLSDMILGPAADVISGRRIAIVPDGALHYVPFAALPLTRTAGINKAAGPEIVVLPSASALARLRLASGTRTPAEKMVAVFADPVFDYADERVGRRNRRGTQRPVKRASAGRDVQRAFGDVGLDDTGVPRLVFSNREAREIVSISSRKKSLVALGFDASKERVVNADLDRYRIVHFATHGLANSRNPDLSGVVLSLVDPNGKNVDGFLRLSDIYNLKLNADLVVLSACSTAIGKEVRGEGLIGLTRGFMYAGSPRVVASLWKVDDVATSHFMSTFYRKMLVESMRPPQALKAAQTEMMKQPRWRSPYYWAPFVLQGEWK